MDVAGELLDYWAGRNNLSVDPYDGLEALGDIAPRAPRAIRLGLVQIHKRSPVNLRPLMRIHPLRNSYGEGLLAAAALELWQLSGEAVRAEQAERALVWLRMNRVRGGWTYPFHVQTKTLYYSKQTPNVVCTSFAAQSFLDAAKVKGDASYLDIAAGAAHFVATELLVEQDNRCWFGYLPGDRRLIHNANLLAARLCILVGAATPDDSLIALGQRAAASTLEQQQADGSFLYGVGGDVAWIDGHHTGFVVECLSDCAEVVPELGGRALTSAADFYRRELFDEDGRPRQAPGRNGIVDGIAGAQGIQTFAKLGELDTASRVARWMIRNMRTRRGTFVYQRGRAHRKAIPYLRWCDAPMARALASLATRTAN